MNIEQILKEAGEIASDTAPVGGGSEYQDAVLRIFKSNPGKKLCGRELKKLFSDNGVELTNCSNILSKLLKAGELERAATGWYVLANK